MLTLLCNQGYFDSRCITAVTSWPWPQLVFRENRRMSVTARTLRGWQTCQITQEKLELKVVKRRPKGAAVPGVCDFSSFPVATKFSSTCWTRRSCRRTLLLAFFLLFCHSTLAYFWKNSAEYILPLLFLCKSRYGTQSEIGGVEVHSFAYFNGFVYLRLLRLWLLMAQQGHSNLNLAEMIAPFYSWWTTNK